MNLVLPALAYIYWTNDADFTNVMAKVNVGTLTGTLVGQLLFGYLADRSGRLQLYGISIALVAVGAIYLAESSTGVNGSLSIVAWITFWRFFTGFATGGGLPLSAIITAE
jgi:PHS family inorganic phosphate transporter-like MFS transporter